MKLHNNCVNRVLNSLYYIEIKMIISIFAVFLSLATVGVLGVNLEQTELSLTKKAGNSAYITCKATGLSRNYVHWYQQKENEPLKRILYTDNQESVVTDTGFQDAKDFKVRVDNEVYTLKINKVKESHSAVYYCASWEYSTGRKIFSSGTRLYVTAKELKAPEVSVYPVSNQQADDKRVLLCQARNMFPDLVRFTWEVKDQNGAKVDLTDNDDVLEQREEPPESQISMLITDQQKAMQYTYTCSVQHEGDRTPKRVTISRDTEKKPTATCPPSVQKNQEEDQEDSFIDGSTELSRSAYLFSITYVMLLVKNVLYFCTVSVSLYKRSADNEEMLFGKVR